MAIHLPLGFRFAGVYSGVKRNATKLDLSLVASDYPAAAAGVYTQNRVFAAPVAYDRARTPAEGMRVVVINSGNANACTGERGLADAAQMAAIAEQAVGAQPGQALVLSTGIIGNFLAMDKISAGIGAAAAALGDNETAFVNAARGMLTTDSTHKVACRRIAINGRQITIAGMAKGAAMIGPNMATMLGLLLTDASLEAGDAQRLLRQIADETFNCISVDGHVSTNDTVLLLANGAAFRTTHSTEVLAGEGLATFASALREVAAELARSIPADGEGATHLVTIHVRGCATPAAARQIAKAVADSPLVKCAVAGADPNWGRIVSAAGYAGIEFDPQGVRLQLNGTLLYERGAPVGFDAESVSAAMRRHRDVLIDLQFSEGTSESRFWTTDLTAEYVRLNADYHT